MVVEHLSASSDMIVARVSGPSAVSGVGKGCFPGRRTWVVPCPHSTAPRRVRLSVMNTHRVGRRFEALAAEYLVADGWTILARNYRFGRKEIDLIVARDRTLAFVEVKGRRGNGFGHPLEAITWRKRREISHVARHWISKHSGGWSVVRFDAIAVWEVDGAPPTVEHTPDAWRLAR